MARLSIHLLGPLQVTLDGEPVTGFESDKVRALLAYLAVEQEAPQRREKLAGLLWPDWTERAARANLRRALANLRKALGDHQAMPPFLHISHHAIQFNRASDTWVDLTACQDLLSVCPPRSMRTSIPMTDPQTIRQMEEAVALYHGDFLEGFSLTGCPTFEEWMLFEEERLRRLALETLDHLSGWYEQRGETKHALQHARRQVEMDPLRESAHRQIMRLLARDGQRGVALAQYETCRHILAEELGVEPGAETRQLYEQIRDGKWQRFAAAPAPESGPELAGQPPSFLAEGTGEVPPPVFVAREREMARLEGFLDEALAGDGKVVFIMGGPGRGKTALLDEFARRAMEAHADLLVASGNCNAYSGVGDPYLPFRDLLGMLTGDVEARWAAGTMDRDHALRLWNALPMTFQALMDRGPRLVPALVPGGALLARARAVAPAGAPWLQRLTERTQRQSGYQEAMEQSHLFQQVTNLLRALAEVHPLLLVLDDLQWVDTASAGLLFHLGRRLQSSRILLAGAYRPEEVALGRHGEQHPLATVLAEFKRAFGDVWLDLANVRAPEGRHFVDALLETEPNRLGGGFRQALFEHTAGHPLFTVELLRTMQERGDLVQDESNCWVEGPALDWKTMPARVEGVIEARIGRLEEDLREILSVASVEGEDFTAQVVARVQGVGQRQALRRLSRELEVRHRLVREQSALRVGRQRLSRYRFAHALFQQYLYNQLGDGERALLHGEIATVLEELYQDHPDGVAAIAPQLSRHFTEAGDEGHALRYLILAGDGALAAYANGEAESYYRRALDLAPGESEQAHLLSGLGEALFRQSRFREAIQTWEVGIDLCGALADSDRLARLYARSAWAADLANDPAEALRLCLEGLAGVEEAAEGPGLARLLHQTALAYSWNGLGEEARTFARQALEMAERLGDVEVQAYALATPGLLRLPSVEDRGEALLRAVDLAESHGLLDAASRAHSSLATLVQRHRGDYRAAREHLRRAAELCGQAGDTAAQVLALDQQASFSILCGELEETGRMLSQTRVLLRDLTEPTYAAQAVLVTEAYYPFFRGEWTECARRARALQASARERGDDPQLADAGGFLAMAALESNLFDENAHAGTWEEAEATLGETMAIWDRSLNVHGSISDRACLGLLCIAQGRTDEARRLLAEAQQKASVELALPEDDGLLHWLDGQVACAEGRWADALAAHEAAHEVCARYGLRWHWARFRLDWAAAHAARGELGDRERAQELLRETEAAFEEVGAPGYAAVTRERLQQLSAAEGATLGQTHKP